MTASFDIDGAKQLSGQPLRESHPGMYEGTFEVHRGDSGKVNVTGRLVEPTSVARKELRLEGALDLFASAPPLVDCPPMPPSEVCDALDEQLRRLAVHFAFARSEVTESDQQLLRGLAAGLAPTSSRLSIHGHADDRGTDEYNV